MAGIRSFATTVTVATHLVGGNTQVNLSPTTVNNIDVTAHDTPSGFREFIGGLKDGGSVSLTFNYVKGNVGQREIIDNPGKTGAIVITLSNGATFTGSAVYGGVGFSAPLDDKVECSVELKWSGAVVFNEIA